MALVDAVEELNKSVRALAAFLTFPSGRGGVTVRAWSTPRANHEENTGILQDIAVNPESVAGAVYTIEAISCPAPV